MKIEIVTPYQHVATDDADEVYAVGPKGEFGILPGHAHYVTPLLTGRLYYTNKSGKKSFLVIGGILEVFNDKVVVLADEVERQDQIDGKAAQTELGKLDEKLAKESMDLEAFAEALNHRRKEEVRVQVAADK